MKKKEVWLVALLVLFGFLYKAIERGKIRLAGDFAFTSADRRLKGSQFVEFPEKERAFSSIRKVVVANPAGEVVVGISGDGQVHASSSLRVYYTKRSDVAGIQKGISIRAESRDGELRIDSQYSNGFPYQQARILMHLLVPRDTVLDISNQEGDTLVKEAGKDIRVTQENGNLVMESIPTGLRLRLKNGNATLTGIAGSVDIVCAYGNVLVDRAHSLRLNGRHGDCSAKNIARDVSIEHAYGKLVLDSADKVEISARHSEIAAANIRNGLVVSDSYEDVFLENISGDVRIISRLSRIDLRRISSPNVVIENSFADTLISDFAGENLDMLLKNGNLDLQVREVSNRINIESRHAELNLHFAALLDPTINIKARQGSIRIQSPLEIDVYEEKVDSFANRAGQKPEILINNTYGNVQISTPK